jgi:hypothetical protein
MNDWLANLPISSPITLGNVRPPSQAPVAAPVALQLDRLTLSGLSSLATLPYPPANYPPGHGLTIVAPGTRVESSHGQTPGASFEGRVAKESLQALQRAGGVSYAYTSRFNGDREVNVWAPPGFDPAKPYEVLLYNRGIDGDNAGALEGTHIATGLQNLNTEGRNVLLVLPKSPLKMHTWFAPPEDAGALLAEAQDAFNQATGMALPPARETLLMAHSGGGKSVANMLAQANPPQFDKILLADSTYGTWAAATADALQRHPGPRISVVVTDHNAQRAAEQLGARGIRVNHMPAHWQFDGHNGVPAYMLNAFLSSHPSLGLSSFQPGKGWTTLPPDARDSYTPTSRR